MLLQTTPLKFTQSNLPAMRNKIAQINEQLKVSSVSYHLVESLGTVTDQCIIVRAGIGRRSNYGARATFGYS